MKLSKFVSIPVFAVFLLMSFVYYITIFVFIEDWVGLQSSAGLLNALIFTFLGSLSLFSFVVCVLTDPGRVPPSYIPDVEESGNLDQGHKNNVVQARNCDKCSAYKPPRTHHCRVCGRCVLRMDHHCVWINNCVGYWNYKAFFVLVLYATLGSIYSTVVIISCVFQKDWNFIMVRLKISYVICGAMMISLTVTLGSLLGWHIYLITHNMTTIEYYEGIRAAWFAKKSGQSYRHPFDVLSPNMLKWLWPNAISHLKDGLSFPSSRNNS